MWQGSVPSWNWYRRKWPPPSKSPQLLRPINHKRTSHASRNILTTKGFFCSHILKLSFTFIFTSFLLLAGTLSLRRQAFFIKEVNMGSEKSKMTWDEVKQLHFKVLSLHQPYINSITGLSSYLLLTNNTKIKHNPYRGLPW